MGHSYLLAMGDHSYDSVVSGKHLEENSFLFFSVLFDMSFRQW